LQRENCRERIAERELQRENCRERIAERELHCYLEEYILNVPIKTQSCKNKRGRKRGAKDLCLIHLSEIDRNITGMPLSALFKRKFWKIQSSTGFQVTLPDRRRDCPHETLRLRLTGLFPGRKNDKDIKAYKKECAVNAVNRNDSTDFSASGSHINPSS
jgi:hypothetical protein